MADENPYEAPAATSESGSTSPNSGTAGLYAVAACHTVVLVAAMMLRDHQLSLDDPYNNPYTVWSTTCMLAAFALWIVGLIGCSYRAVRKLHVPKFVKVWLVLFSLYVAWFLINLVAFVA